MASYDIATFKVNEFFSTTLTDTNVFLWRLHGCVHEFMYLFYMTLKPDLIIRGASAYLWPYSIFLFVNLLHVTLELHTETPLDKCTNICIMIMQLSIVSAQIYLVNGIHVKNQSLLYIQLFLPWKVFV